MQNDMNDSRTNGHESTEGVPVAWGRVIDGKAVTVSLEKTAANDEPLYAGP